MFGADGEKTAWIDREAFVVVKVLPPSVLRNPPATIIRGFDGSTAIGPIAPGGRIEEVQVAPPSRLFQNVAEPPATVDDPREYNTPETCGSGTTQHPMKGGLNCVQL